MEWERGELGVNVKLVEAVLQVLYLSVVPLRTAVEKQGPLQREHSGREEDGWRGAAWPVEGWEAGVDRLDASRTHERKPWEKRNLAWF